MLTFTQTVMRGPALNFNSEMKNMFLIEEVKSKSLYVGNALNFKHVIDEKNNT